MAREELTMSPVPIGGLAVAHHLGDIPALGADARHQERHVAGERAHLREFCRIGGADHQRAVAARVPALRGQLRDDLVQLAPADLQVLQVAGAGIGGAAQDDDAAVLVRQERLQGIAAEVGIHGHGIGAVALEGLDGVALGGVADIAALAVQDHRNAG